LRILAATTFLLTLQAADLYAAELFVCGWDEVFLLNVDADPPQKVWSWRAKDRPELPERFQNLFRTTDECKPIDGQRLLISASSGGLALVQRPSGSVLWYGYVGNAHSIELLPQGRVAVAGSTNDEGNRVAIFDLSRPDEQLYSVELYSGHGVVWDPERELLWGLSYKTLNAYRLENWDTASPALSQAQTFELPDPGGHDLHPVPGSQDLVVTTNRNVFLFDREQQRFRPHPLLKDKKRVKGVSIHPMTGRLVYVQAEGENWWASRLILLNPSRTLQLPGERIYKARWLER
jgi:hypothetical protein